MSNLLFSRYLDVFIQTFPKIKALAKEQAMELIEAWSEPVRKPKS